MQKKDSRYYKGKYFITFYADDDETFLYAFDNIYDILDFKHLAHNDQNKKTMQCNIMRALKWRNHETHCLTGKLMHVYLVDVFEKETDDDA